MVNNSTKRIVMMPQNLLSQDKVYTVNIKDAVDASVNSLKIAGVEITDFAKGNEKARERMKAQILNCYNE